MSADARRLSMMVAMMKLPGFRQGGDSRTVSVELCPSLGAGWQLRQLSPGGPQPRLMFTINVSYSFTWTPALRRLVTEAGYDAALVATEVENRVNTAGGLGERKLPKAGTKAASRPDCRLKIGSKGNVVLEVAGQKIMVDDKIDSGTASVVSLNDTLEDARMKFTLGAECGPQKLPAWFRQWLSELPEGCVAEAQPAASEPVHA